MFVPLAQLYNFLDQYVFDDTLIYHFFIAGDKNISNIRMIDHHSPDIDWDTLFQMLMHDQEPLNFDYYSSGNSEDILKYINTYLRHILAYGVNDTDLLKFFLDQTPELNLSVYRHSSKFDKWLLCHSELNSENLKKYESIGAVGVYWWSHALISKDWYRFAQLDPCLLYTDTFIKDFNIYNRAWANTREYRLKFTELILNHQLDKHSLVKFSPTENNTHYTEYKFNNPLFSIKTDLTTLPPNNSLSDASADYSYKDYQQCAIDIVLETLFDDARHHLTEKTLRPIACGKPFILVATPGSLQYLKNYGFKTFDHLIDESYDKVINPLDRLNAIIKLMKDISAKSDSEKVILYQKMHEIAAYNKSRFWSDEFSKNIVDEFVTNYHKAYNICQSHCTGNMWKAFRDYVSSISPAFKNTIKNNN